MAWRELVPTLFGDHNEAVGVTSDSVGETAGQVVVIGAAVLVAMTNSHLTTRPNSCSTASTPKKARATWSWAVMMILGL